MFPLNALGQPASVLADSASGSEDSAFAETLATALAASTLTAAMPVQQYAGTPSVALEGGLSGSASPIGGEPTGNATRTIGGPEIGPNVEPAKFKAMPSDVPPVNGVGGAGMDITPVGIDHAGLASSAMAKAAERGVRDSRHPEPVSAEARVGQTPAVTTLDRPGASAGNQLADGSPDRLQDRLSQVAADRRGSASIDEATVAAIRDQSPAGRGNGPVEVPPSRVPLADPVLDRATRAVRPTNPLPTIGLTGQVGPASPPEAIIHPNLVSDQTQRVPERPGLSRLPIDLSGHAADMPIESTESAGARVRREGAALAAGHPQNASSAPGQPVGNRQAEQAAATAMTRSDRANLKGFADQHRSVAGHPIESRPDRPSAAATEAGGQSMSATTPSGGGVPTTVLETGLRSSSEIGGFDRLQPALSSEGAARNMERFEPASSSSALRGQAATANPSAGAQVALQIVRSLPQGVDRLSLQLQPAELGSVDIQLNFEGAGRLSALITAERPETLELLQRDSRFLERSLGDSGLKLASDGLSFALKQDQQQQQHGQNFHEQAQARQAALRAGQGYGAASEAEPTPPTQRIERLRLLDIET
ncbi:MAG: flagellar hook-length control protein FliK [Alphaproteobacteria bacterium]|nr:flagellar hook-length control protein FliK [Alphaproteobacteria bacterium]